MKDKGRADWRQIFALFERWQTTPSSERAALVAGIRERSPELYPQFIAMLQADAGADEHGFMADDALSQLTEAEPQPDKWNGVRLGPWVLREPIGVGGMGQVWLATRGDNLYSGRAAVKLLHMAHASADANARFAREGEFLARLAHPRIAQLYDAGLTEDGTRYLVLEHVPGEALDLACDRQALSIEARLQLFLQVCEAVAYAHLQRVVHRDLKPSNILVTADGHVKLLDFGVAKIMSDAGSNIEATQLGSQWFTLDYAAPEQVESGVITTATDVFSLGVVLFRLLSGAKPHEGVRTLSDVIRKLDKPRRSMLTAFEHGDSTAIAAQHSCTVNRMRQELRGDLATIVAKCLKDVPSERYDTAQALGDDLRRYLAREPLRARPDSWSYRTRKFIERNRIQAVAAAAIAVTLLAGVSVSMWQKSEAQREAARRELAINFLTNLFTQFTPEHSGSAEVSVVELLSRGWKQAALDFDKDPQVKAEIARPLGMMLSYAGEYAVASQALTASAEQMRASGRTHTNDYLRVLRELGYAQLRVGDTTRAKQSFDEVLSVASGMSGVALESPLSARLHLAVIAQQNGQLDLAQQQLETVARIAKQHLGESAPPYVQAMDLLRMLASERGNLVVQAPQATPPAQTNPERQVRSRYEDGVRALERGDFVAATATFRDVAPAMQRLYGMQNSDAIFAYVWLSVALFNSGDVAASNAAITRAYKYAERSPEQTIQHHVAIVMARQLARGGRSSEGAPLIAKALAYFESVPDSARFAERARLVQGEILLQQGRLAEADALLLRTHDNQLRIFGGYHRELCQTLTLRALATDLQVGPATALPLYRKARDVATEFIASVDNPERRKAQLFLDYATWRKEQSVGSQSTLLRTVQAYKQRLAARADFAAFDVLSNELSRNAPRTQVHDTLLALLNY